jgi:membrane-associated phospholipid phosphatase
MRRARPGTWAERVERAAHPADKAITALLILAAAVAVIRWPAVGPELTPYVLLQLGLLAAYAVAAWAMARWQEAAWVAWARPIVTVALILSLYTALGKLGVAAMPYQSDPWLSWLDNRLFGFDPSLAIQRFQTPGWVEFYSFIYGAFIPYIYLSLALGCLGRPPTERDQFLTGWALTYTISYVGYLFLPGHGPVVFQADQHEVALEGGLFYRIVVLGNEATGGLQGIFPSLHVGGSLYLCLFDMRRNRLRGMTYLPMVLLIYVATIFLRYHYVVDLIAGTVIAFACVPLGEAVFNRWLERRKAAGVAALPGREVDAVSDHAGLGPASAGTVLPAR